MKRKALKQVVPGVLAASFVLGSMAMPAASITADAAKKSGLEKSVQKIVKKSKAAKETNQKKALKKLFRYVEKNYGYARTIGFENTKGWEKTFAKEMIQGKKGSCYHYAALYAFLAKKATGYSVRICLGKTNGFNASRWQDHAWCEIKIGKKWYIFDTNMDKFAANSKGKYFMRSVSSMKKTFKRTETIQVKF